MGRIATTFDELRARGEAALIIYLMLGYPSMEDTPDILKSVASAGADLVELGVPFSDPLADGVTLQRIGHQALLNGATLRRALEMVSSVRDRIKIPLILMSYFNPILRMGEDIFADEAAAAGVDGVIVPDLPVEESNRLIDLCGSGSVDVVGMVAPTSSDERIRAIAHRASGFIYCVSLRGVTGARDSLPSDVDRLVGRVRQATDLPVAVGFGISSPEQVSSVTAFADGAVVGSALMDYIAKESVQPAISAARFVRTLKVGCRRR